MAEAPVLGVLLLSGTHERAHYALMLATSAAALGRRVVVFATNDGCRALLRDWSGLDDAGRDASVQAAGAAGFAELREAAVALGVRFTACGTGLLMAGIDPAGLMPEAAVTGLADFLGAAGGGQLVSV